MKLKTRGDDGIELDMSSFSDIAFLLIIFFILTTTFVKPFGRELEIPSGTSDTSKKEQKQLQINLKSRRIMYGEKAEQVTIEQLRELLNAEQLGKRPQDDRIVVVECTEDVPYEQYFQVVMAITQAGGVLALIEESGE